MDTLKASGAPVAVLALAAVLLGGCASAGNKDPLEGYNRAIFAFNEGLDKVALKPAAKGYEAAVPLPGRVAVSNFFSNVGDAWIAVNNLLQGKPGEAMGDVGRVLVNSTVGILGMFDVATELGLEKHDEDFGQTLGRWGVGDGAYIVWPLIGGRTLRDSGGFAVDAYVDPVGDIDRVATRNSLLGLRVIDTRAQLLPADQTIEEASFDKYAYLRDAYLQLRRSLIHDGNPPRLEEDEGALAPGAASFAAGHGLPPPVGDSSLPGVNPSSSSGELPAGETLSQEGTAPIHQAAAPSAGPNP